MKIETQVLVTDGTRPAQMTQHAREALYASITGIATLLVMIPSAEAFTGRSAAGSLLGTMGGLFAASLVADTIAHASERGGATRRGTMRRILGSVDPRAGDHRRARRSSAAQRHRHLESEDGADSRDCGSHRHPTRRSSSGACAGAPPRRRRKPATCCSSCAAVGAVVLLKVVVH